MLKKEDRGSGFFLVATPIGNLDDISIRAKKVLASVDIILAEDTRKTSQMLKKIGLDFGAKLISFYEQNEIERVPMVVEALSQGKSVALVSNAGTPLISDPGFKLVNHLIRLKVKIVPIPGPSAFVSALIASGFHPDHFVFLGFLPKKLGKKRKIFDQIKKLSPKIIPTICFYESPTRLVKTLKLIEEVFGNKQVVIGREMTKVHEQFIRGKVKKLLLNFKNQGKLKGEVTVVLNIGD